MKKLISCILYISLLASIICVPVSAVENIVVTENIEEFCEDVNEMVTEYSDSDFVTPDFIEDEQISENIDEEIEINYCPRLIVQSNKPIDTYNAVDVVNGFSDFYIVQFKNEEDTNYAYEQYENNPDIISVEYDISYDAVTLSTENTSITEELTYQDYKNDWYLSSTGIDKVLEKYKDKNPPEIRVAVIDTGVNLNSAYLQDRIIKTNYNTAGDGDENSEQDYEGHGTKVTSVIANCTTPNVKIANYRCVNRFGEIKSFTLVCTAILQAIDDGVKAINLSLGAPSDFKLLDEILEFAWSSSCAVFTSSGNDGNDVQFSAGSVLTSSEFMVSVGGSTKYNAPANFTNYGKPIDILAPSKDMALLTLNDKFSLSSGTSFASPFMVSVYAMYLSVNQTIPFEQRMRAVMNCGSGTDEEYVTNFFGSGIVNPLKLFGLDSLSAPKFSIEPGKYVGEITLGLSSEEGSDIYYTTDYSYPSPTNGFLYTEPITIYDDSAKIRAVAYKDGNKSNYVFGKFCSLVLGTDDMFTVNEKGVLTGYTGNVKYLKIPEVINGITVKEISSLSGFNKAELYGVILPDTVEVLGDTLDRYERPMTLEEQYGPFNDNQTLDFIVGNGIKTIGYYGVSFIPNLYEVEFPNCEEIMQAGFFKSSFIGAVFPKVKIVGNEAFYNVAKVREIYLPECEKIGNDAFALNTFLRIVYAPKADFLEKYDLVDGILSVENPESTRSMFYKSSQISSIDLPKMTSIGNNFFDETPVKNVSLSNVEYIFDLPDTLSGNYCWYSPYYRPVPVELCLPSTLQYCVPATDYKNEFIEYVVYGTADKKSYAEQWAEENGIQFINISQGTAIVEDIEPIWDKYSYKPLEFDARGFNRTYQWYGSYDAEIGNDIEITNATDKTFNPDEYKAYPYYYCIMTSTDKNTDGETVSEVTVTSSMCENRLYYMFARLDTYINFDNNLIYTKTKACTDILKIISVQTTTDYSALPSYNNYWYGTGSELVVYDDENQEKKYVLIVEGDINGDSAVDVLDASVVSLVANNHTTLTDAYFIAGDTNADEEITVEDYAQVVNLVLAG